jgi:drug/metabolite transporter (DMT)-like permease
VTGEVAALGAALTWAVSISLYHAIGSNLPAFSLNFLKSAVAVVGLGAAVICGAGSLPTSEPKILWLLFSGVIGIAIGDACFFVALKSLGAQRTASIQTAGPAAAAVIGAVYFNEPLNQFESIGLVTTLTAVLGIVWLESKNRARLAESVNSSTSIEGWIYGLLAALSTGVSMNIVRSAIQGESPVAAAFLRMLAAAATVPLISLVLGNGLALRPLVELPKARLCALIGTAFLGSCFGFSLGALSLKYTKAGVASAIMATYPVWMIPISMFLLREKVRAETFVMTLVAVGGIALMLF